MEARSGRKTAEFYAGGWLYPVTLDGGAAWVGGPRGLAKLDGTRGVLTSSGAVKPVTGIAYGAGSVWLTYAATAEVVRLGADTGAVEARIPLGGRGEDVVVDRGLVWVVVPPSE